MAGIPATITAGGLRRGESIAKGIIYQGCRVNQLTVSSHAGAAGPGSNLRDVVRRVVTLVGRRQVRAGVTIGGDAAGGTVPAGDPRVRNQMAPRREPDDVAKKSGGATILAAPPPVAISSRGRS